jgi:hypothetical protein
MALERDPERRIVTRFRSRRGNGEQEAAANREASDETYCTHKPLFSARSAVQTPASKQRRERLSEVSTHLKFSTITQHHRKLAVG